MNEIESRDPVHTLISQNPRILEEHAVWLNSTGGPLLNVIERHIRGDLWPWDRPQHEQAAYGAFCSGAQFAIRFIRELVPMIQDKNKLAELLKQAGAKNADEDVERILAEFNFTEEDITKGTE